MTLYQINNHYYKSIDDCYNSISDSYHSYSSYDSGIVISLEYDSSYESNLKKRNINRVEPVGILHWICLFFGGKL